MQKLRCDYWEQIRDVSTDNLVFFDETGVNLAMVLLYDRALKGQRAYGKRPEKKGKNVTLIGAMALSGLIASFRFEGATDGDAFLFFVEHLLRPQLWPGAVVVMDNLRAHKVGGVSEALAKVGASVVYLSPYLPDFNTTEHCWSKLKAELRRMEAAGSRERPDYAICGVLNLLTHSYSELVCPPLLLFYTSMKNAIATRGGKRWQEYETEVLSLSSFFQLRLPAS